MAEKEEAFHSHLFHNPSDALPLKAVSKGQHTIASTLAISGSKSSLKKCRKWETLDKHQRRSEKEEKNRRFLELQAGTPATKWDRKVAHKKQRPGIDSLWWGAALLLLQLVSYSCQLFLIYFCWYRWYRV